MKKPKHWGGARTWRGGTRSKTAYTPTHQFKSPRGQVTDVKKR